MELKTVKISSIKPYDRNPRRNDPAVDAVAESIRQCGYCAPILVDEDGVILAGHTRLKALKKLGRKETEVVVRDGLSEEQKRKYRLLDNKTGELADWDSDLLDIELEGLDFDGFDFGFESEESGTAEPGGAEPAEGGFTYKEQYGVIVMCADETEQEAVYTRLSAEGFECKVVVV